MKIDDDMEALLVLPREFPYLQLREIASLLERASVFVPGDIPPPVGLYDLEGFFHHAWVDRLETFGWMSPVSWSPGKVWSSLV